MVVGTITRRAISQHIIDLETTGLLDTTVLKNTVQVHLACGSH